MSESRLGRKSTPAPRDTAAQRYIGVCRDLGHTQKQLAHELAIGEATINKIVWGYIKPDDELVDDLRIVATRVAQERLRTLPHDIREGLLPELRRTVADTEARMSEAGRTALRPGADYEADLEAWTREADNRDARARSLADMLVAWARLRPAGETYLRKVALMAGERLDGLDQDQRRELALEFCFDLVSATTDPKNDDARHLVDELTARAGLAIANEATTI